MIDRYILPIAPFALITACMVLFVYVFILLKQEIRRIQSRLTKQREEILGLRQEVEVHVAQLKDGIRASDQRVGVLVAPEPPSSGLNLSKRSQALRLSRSGEDSAGIAARLNLPRNEVDLLLKVQKIVLGESGLSTS
jgi:hypothetical protein